MTPALLTAAAVLAIMGLPALYNWLTRPKRPKGWNRYDPPRPPLPGDHLAVTLTEAGARRLLADLLRAGVKPENVTEQEEQALQDLMASINGRFTSRSEEPDDA